MREMPGEKHSQAQPPLRRPENVEGCVEFAPGLQTVRNSNYNLPGLTTTLNNFASLGVC
jgi:hypothetical protein